MCIRDRCGGFVVPSGGDGVHHRGVGDGFRAGTYSVSVSYTHLLPKEGKRPVNIEDLKISPQQQELVANVIVDGNLIPANLKQMGKDESWLKKEMEKQNMHNYSEILLGTLDTNDVFTAYPYHKDEFKRTLFV